jgi:hypothetical protein
MVKRKTERYDPEPPKLVAEKVLRRLTALDVEMRNLNAFCVLLKELNARLIAEKPVVEGPHANAVRMVRAGILRAALGSVMACLDPTDQKRGNRASVGGILGLLEDTGFLQQLRESHEELRKDPLFERVKRLRDDIAHNLDREDARTLTSVEYQDVYNLAARAGDIVVQLFMDCGRGNPEFPEYQGPSVKYAKLFWDTYFLGLRPRG